MARAIIYVSLNNVAFAGDGVRKELPRLLRELADKIQHEGPVSPRGMMDFNGNTVGVFHYSPDKDIDLNKV